MTRITPRLSREEINAMLIGDGQRPARVCLSPAELAELLGRSPKTIYEWTSRGFLDGTYRKRGRHVVFVAHRVLDKIFNGADWKRG